MKTILYLITQSEFGGAQRYIFDLADNLKSEFNIAVASGEERKEGEFAQKLKTNNIKYYALKNLKRQISPFNDFLAIFEIIKLIKKIKPDIIHLNSSKISILGSLAAKICYVLRVPCYVIYTAHGWVFNEPLPKWKKTFYRWAEKLTAYFKNKIICVSKPDYKIAKNDLKIKEDKLELIYHGLAPINFLSREQAIQKLTLEINNSTIDNRQSTILIGSIANLYKTKGLEYLIEATKILAEMLRVTCYVLRVVIIGEGEERKNLEDLIAQLNLKSRIFFVGSIKKAAELLPAFDIYINSSVKEGFPYSILEAMSAGLPIIATDVGGIPEMLNDGLSGLLVPPQSPKELAKRIKILIEDKNLRSALGAQAKKDAEERFGMEKMVEETKKIYEEQL